METKDSNGNILANGDAVILIKDLSGKGFDTLKRGTVVKNIRLGDNPEEIEWRANGTMMVLRTMFVKKKK